MRDPYEILQVSKNAEPEVIEAAYRRLARKYHPDVNPSADAEAKMKELNWAYEFLRDPLEKSRFDRAHATKARPSARPSYSKPSGSPPGPRPSPQPRPRPSPIPKASEVRVDDRSFLQKHWVAILIVGGLIYGLIRSLAAGSTPSYSVDASNANQSGQGSSSPVEDPYEDCIDWRSADLYDGQTKCVLGRIVVVTHEFDRFTGSEVWTGHFSFDPEDDFKLISVDRDISRWQGQCVSVYGKLFDRELLEGYADDAQPSMVDSDPFDGRGFTISRAPDDEC